MFLRHRFSSAILVAAAVVFTAISNSPVFADTFGTGVNTFSIEFVLIGDVGNAADTTGDPNPAGAVDYFYRMGKYEISEQMIRKANALTADSDNPLNITIDERGPDKPATRASWFEAARFVNWLNTSTGNTPAYKFDANGEFQLWEPTDAGYNPNNLFRNTQAHYFLPSADEWYKAAFYDPITDTWYDYPNGSNDPPIPVASGTDSNTAVYDQPYSQGPADIFFAGGPSPYGTVGQAGNVREWEETAVDLANDDPNENHAYRGYDWNGGNPWVFSSSYRDFGLLPSNNSAVVGFRVASVPEPSSLWLFAVAMFAVVGRRKRVNNNLTLHEL